MIALEAHDLTRRFKATLALDGLSFAVQSGTLHGLVGPDGAGKTTAIRALAGLIPLDRGWASVLGKDIAKDGSRGLLGIMPQEASLYPDLTVVENQRWQGQLGATPTLVNLSTLYNPTGDSAWFIVPGLAAYLLAISAVLLTALTIAGEWERGSMEQLFASPLGRLEIVLGKLLPYLILGMVQLLLVILLGTTVFHVPMLGSRFTLLLAGFLFLVGMLGQGLLISVVTRNQLVATQAGALSSLLPSLILSGMIVPIESMPWALQVLSSIIPARYLVHAFRSLMLKGADIATIGSDL